MKSILTKSIIPILTLLVACNSSGEISNDLPVIDITGAYPEKDINLSDIAEVEYIQLKTPDTMVISKNSLANVAISEDNIVLRDIQRGDIYLFDNNGNYINSFNRKGRSGEEYDQFIASGVDFENREIVIDNGFVRSGDGRTILIYSFEGDFKRKFNMPDSISIGAGLSSIFNYDKEHYLVYNGHAVDLTHPLFAGRYAANENPFLLITKDTGAVVALDITAKDRYGNLVVDVLEESGNVVGISMTNIGIHQILHSGNNMVLSEFALDTVYNYRDGKLTPILSWDRSKVAGDDKYIGNVYISSSSLYFVKTAKKPADGEKISVDLNILYVDRAKNETYKVSNMLFSDIEDFYLETLSTSVMDGCAYFAFDAYELMDMNDEGRLSGKLQEIANTLNEEDNPIIGVLRFK